MFIFLFFGDGGSASFLSCLFAVVATAAWSTGKPVQILKHKAWQVFAAITVLNILLVIIGTASIVQQDFGPERISEVNLTTASPQDLKHNFSDPTAPTAENVFSREESDLRLGTAISTGSNLGLYSTEGPNVQPMCADAFTCNYVARLLYLVTLLQCILFCFRVFICSHTFECFQETVLKIRSVISDQEAIDQFPALKERFIALSSLKVPVAKEPEPGADGSEEGGAKPNRTQNDIDLVHQANGAEGRHA